MNRPQSICSYLFFLRKLPVTSTPVRKPRTKVNIKSKARDMCTGRRRIFVSTGSRFCQKIIAANTARTMIAIKFPILNFLFQHKKEYLVDIPSMKPN